MKKYGLSLVPLLLLVLIMGCSEEFYEFNLFAGMDPVTAIDVEDLKDMDQTSALEVLSDEVSSDSFIEQLKDDTDQKDEILTYLGDIFMDEGGLALTAPETEEELDNYRDAALLYADINMAVSGGDEFANNVFELLTTLQDTGDDGTDPDGTDPEPTEPFGEDQVRDMINSLLPAEVDTPEEYETLISGLQSAIIGYEALGDTIGDGEAEVTPDDAPDDIILGEVAQNAICAVIVDIVIDVLDDPADETDDPVLEFFEWIEEGTSPEIDETVLQTKMEDVLGSTDPEDPDAPASEYDGVTNLLLAAGLGTMLESFGGSSEEPTDGTTK